MYIGDNAYPPSDGIRTLTPGLSPAKKRKTAVLPDGRFAI